MTEPRSIGIDASISLVGRCEDAIMHYTRFASAERWNCVIRPRTFIPSRCYKAAHNRRILICHRTNYQSFISSRHDAGYHP